MSDGAPVLVWIRRDLRLADHAALTRAAETGRPTIPVFLLDEAAEALGAAPKWRLGLGVRHFARTLAGIGSRLILRRGPALATLRALIAETGAKTVYWQRAYDPASKARDTRVKAALKADGIAVKSCPGHLLFEPWTVETKTGGFYKVYTPFWKAVAGRDPGAPLPAVARLRPPATWPASDDIDAWVLDRAMGRGAAVTERYVRIGAAAAEDRLQDFAATRLARYASDRDRPDIPGTSRLSENLTYGEISPRQCWQAGRAALDDGQYDGQDDGQDDAETFLKELVWREFAYHLLHHTPEIAERNWRPEWDDFPWDADPDRPQIRAWRQGRTGIAFVDAAMRELYVTGYMHNRARMIAASYLTKHLLGHWRIGLNWFAEHLVDWDPASNAMGWQWAAGSGPDAAPYFRVFNPVTQLDKFDPDRAYATRWIAEGQDRPGRDALAYFDAIPRRWGLSPDAAYPDPVVDAAEGRARALAAYERWKA